MFQKVFFLSLLLVLAGCSITQTVEPVTEVSSSHVCVIDNPAVRDGFLNELRNQLRGKNAQITMLRPEASLRDCPLIVTYTARWSWDLTIYMAYAEIRVFENGSEAGSVVYDATKGSGRLDKFVDAEPKIRELVDQLFPLLFPNEPNVQVADRADGPELFIPASAVQSNGSDQSSDLYDRLLELEDLRQKGILTEDEFAAQKAKLLITD